ncbi:TPA: hypothetical protein UM512_001713 [Stenotrophomonas maltophilia]|uniref:hypothetical protein n=1 Tax=Stenotrophomonas maltophilia TaxID=40324 RepID=UPI002A938311|nr:hypothetical protein [Stenotrophomonas maltophilia]
MFSEDGASSAVPTFPDATRIGSQSQKLRSGSSRVPASHDVTRNLKGHQMKRITLFVGLAVALALGQASAATPGSRYLQLAADQRVQPGTATLLSSTIDLNAPGWVYVQSDGRYFPGGRSAANAYITINGEVVSNDSYIDWRQSTSAQQHSFNVIGAKYLPAGHHTVNLAGQAIGSAVNFGSASNLSVLITSAGSVTNSSLPSDTAQLDFNTVGSPEGMALQAKDRKLLMTAQAGNPGGPIVAMASGRAFAWGNYGDGMMGIFLNEQEPGIESMTWSINDIFSGAETQAPFYSQGLFVNPPAYSTVSFVASESPYYQPQDANTNNVKYKFGANSRLVTLSNGFGVVGKGLNPGFNYAAAGPYRRFAYVCVGTNGFAPGCPPAGSQVVIGEGQVCIPQGHNGVVLFSTKSRVQGDPNDGGGSVFLFLKIDGQQVGSLGTQQLGSRPDSVSTRTISASYLSAGSSALGTGCHTVQAVAQVLGDFRHMSLNADMPLVWFD